MLPPLSPQRLQKKRKHPPPRHPTERRQLQRIMSHRQFQSPRLRPILPQSPQHLVRKLRQKRWIIFPVHHERIPPRPHSSFHIRHRTYRHPEFPQLLHAHLVPQSFPHMVRRHPLAHHIRQISRHMEQSPRPHPLVMHQRDVPHRRPDASPQYPQPVISPLFQPTQTRPSIFHRLPVRLQRQSNVRPHQLVRALMSLCHPPVVIRQTHLQCRNPHSLQPVAQRRLSMPLRIPVRQDQHRWPNLLPRKELRMHGIVLRPSRHQRARKRQHVLPIQPVIPHLVCSVPLLALLRSLPRILPQKAPRLHLRRVPTDVLQSPLKPTHHPVIVGSPPPVLIPPYPVLIPAHSHTLSLTSSRPQPGRRVPQVRFFTWVLGSSFLCAPLRSLRYLLPFLKFLHSFTLILFHSYTSSFPHSC